MKEATIKDMPPIQLTVRGTKQMILIPSHYIVKSLTENMATHTNSELISKTQAIRLRLKISKRIYNTETNNEEIESKTQALLSFTLHLKKLGEKM